MSVEDTRAFLNDVEGHLLVAATREEGRTAATQFCAPLHWLTDAQRADVERRFESEYLALTRLSWQRTAARAREVRGEYEEAYRRLRRRLLAWCLLGGAALVALVCLVWPRAT